MEITFLDNIKRISIIALASDDYLMETLVLKGGNAIQFFHKANERGSFDIDYSISDDFEKDHLEVENRIKKTLEVTFFEHGYIVFDFKMKARPNQMRENVQNFWGGYKIKFKISTVDTFNQYENNIDALRRNAIKLNPNDKSPKFEIEISKHEYVSNKMEMSLDGYTVFVYAPEMIVFEKLRAICQQNDEYSEIIGTQTQTQRARDFYDIYTLMEYYPIDINTEESKQLLIHIFDCKKVPLTFLHLIEKYKDRHEKGFDSVLKTISNSEDQRDFNFYFEYVLSIIEKLSVYKPEG